MYPLFPLVICSVGVRALLGDTFCFLLEPHSSGVGVQEEVGALRGFYRIVSMSYAGRPESTLPLVQTDSFGWGDLC